MAFKMNGFPMHSGTSGLKQTETTETEKPKVNERAALLNEMNLLEKEQEKEITNEGQIRLQNIADRLTEMDKEDKKKVEI